MLSHEILQAHYIEYGSQPDAWVENMLKTKRSIIRYVLGELHIHPDARKKSVAVLGVSDKRYLFVHEQIFHEFLGTDTSIVTFDIDTDHLGDSSNIIYHDVTKTFPYQGYDIIFSHALMKFLSPEEQLVTVKNSVNALKSDGFAMHIMHEPELAGTVELREWQHRVDLPHLSKMLQDEGVKIKILSFQSESVVPWLRATTILVASK